MNLPDYLVCTLCYYLGTACPPLTHQGQYLRLNISTVLLMNLIQRTIWIPEASLLLLQA